VTDGVYIFYFILILYFNHNGKEMDCACSAYGGGKRRVQDFGGKT
jgi:hypothetical protein